MTTPNCFCFVICVKMYLYGYLNDWLCYHVRFISDPCPDLTVRNHPYIGKCRAYWTCKKGASNARCCPKGYGYGGTAGKKECVPMATCNDECVSTPTANEMKTRYGNKHPQKQ